MKQKVLELLQQAREAAEQLTIEGRDAADEEAADAHEELIEAIDGAMERVAYFAD